MCSILFVIVCIMHFHRCKLKDLRKMSFACDVTMSFAKYFGKREISIAKNAHNFATDYCYIWLTLAKSIKENGRGTGSEH